MVLPSPIWSRSKVPKMKSNHRCQSVHPRRNCPVVNLPRKNMRGDCRSKQQPRPCRFALLEHKLSVCLPSWFEPAEKISRSREWGLTTSDNHLSIFHRLVEPRAISLWGTHLSLAENPPDSLGSQW